MDDTFGHEETIKWLNDNYKAYQKGKGKEMIEEKPLLYVDQALYLSRSKGGLALYALAQRIGIQPFDRWLGNWITKAGQKERRLTSADFYGELTDTIPDDLHPLARDWFERRIQYRISIIRYSIKDQVIELTLSAEKKDHDPAGARAMPFSAWFEVGSQDANGQLSAVKKIKLQPGTRTYRITSNSIPESIILDPHYWYLIENRRE